MDTEKKYTKVVAYDRNASLPTWHTKPKAGMFFGKLLYIEKIFWYLQHIVY